MDSICKIEKIVAQFKYWIRFLKFIIRILFYFRNSFSIIINMFQNNYPLNGYVNKVKNIKLISYNYINFFINSKKIPNIEFDFENDFVITPLNKFNYTSKKYLKFFGGISNGDVINIIYGDDYEDIPVKDKIVVDIGSNIGDSSIKFAVKGAKHVFGFEPYPKNFNLSLKNILENKFSDKISIILAGCGSENSSVLIDPNFDSSSETKLKTFPNGMKVPIYNLEKIIKEFGIPKNSILKIDCEGCEYEIIFSSSFETLNHFSFIKIEYHDGYKKLKDFLIKAGFKVEVSSPTATNIINNIFKKSSNNNLVSHIGYVGYISAIKI